MITMHIPKDREAIDINKEIMSARNIKDKSVKNDTLTGLNKIAKYI